MTALRYTLVTAVLLLGPAAPASAAESSAAESHLADAAEARQWAQVPRLLAEGADPNAAQVTGMTALHWAAWHDHAPTVVHLLEARADAAARNRYGISVLSLACENGNGPIVRRLLEAGADANRAGPGGETPLMTAARAGRREPVQALLQHGARVDARDRNDQTAIMWAAAEGHAPVVQLLLDAEADFQTPLDSGFTPLLFAVREGRREVVQVLLDAGADVNSTMQPRAAGGRAPRPGTSPLLLAIENGHFQLAEELLQAGANPNDQRSGYSPLHALSWVRKPNLGDGLDGTPPPIGSGNRTSLELAAALVEHGADVNLRLRRGRAGRGRLKEHGATPFLLAADTADVPFMRLLLKLGADPTIPNADRCPPLLAAAGIGTLAPGEEAGTEEEALAAVRLLLELGADINAVDANGETAMHGAAYKSLPKMVALLAERGADIRVWNRENRYGWTPLEIAEGYRPGNFKPAPETIAALHQAMRAAGVEPPPPTRRRPINDLYETPKEPPKKGHTESDEKESGK